MDINVVFHQFLFNSNVSLANHLGFYVAKARGLFAARGLDVNLLSASDPDYSGSYHGDDDPSGKSAFVTPCQKVRAQGATKKLFLGCVNFLPGCDCIIS